MTERSHLSARRPLFVFPRVRVREFVGYFASSLCALVADFALYFLLNASGLHYLWAATAGYFFGALVAFTLSVHYVFRERRWNRLSFEFVVFTALGLVGYLVTVAVMFIAVEYLRIGPEWSKVMAATASFVANFIVRKAVLFRR